MASDGVTPKKAEAEAEATKCNQLKKRGPQRKRAQDWRKNIDISPLEGQLDLLRTEERLIGPSSAPQTEPTTTNINTNTNANANTNSNSTTALFYEDKLPDVKQAKRQHGQKILRIDEILQLDSKLPPLNGKSRPNADPKTGARSRTEVSKVKAYAKQLGRLNKSAMADSSPNQAGVVDLWLDEEPKAALVSLARPARPMKHPRTRIPVLDAVHPGSSYLPSEEAYQAALQAALQVERARPDPERLPHATPIPEPSSVQHGLADQDSGSTETPCPLSDPSLASDLDSACEVPPSAAVKPRLPKRKTRAQRKRALQEKENLERRKQEKTRALLLAQLDQLQHSKKLRKQLAQDALLKDSLLLQRKRQTRLTALKSTKRLSRHPFEPAMFPVMLPSQREPSLRRLVPQGNPVTDRFKNLQARNLIEVRVPTRMKRSHKLRIIERPSYKSFR